MKPVPILPKLIERFFTERLMRQRHVSSPKIESYRDTFRLLLKFAQVRLHTPPSNLDLRDLDAPLVSAFLDDLETSRTVSILTRNLRLTAIRSFFRFTEFEEPAYSAHIQRVLAIPSKRHDKRLVQFLTRSEIEALLAAPDRTTWVRRRDHALLLLAVQTGLRLSELIGLDRDAIISGRLTGNTVSTMQTWLQEPSRNNAQAIFPSIHSDRLSADAVQYLLGKYTAIASTRSPSLMAKRVTPHVLRHTAAMVLLQAGVDSSIIALWLGHESVETTQVYLHAYLAIKEAALAKIKPLNGKRPDRYRPGDQLLAFLNAL